MTGSAGRLRLPSMSRWLRAAVLPASLAVSLALLLGYFGYLHPALDSFSHLRAHLAVLLGFLGLLLLIGQAAVTGALALIVGTLAFLSTTAAFPGLGVGYGALHAADPKRPVYRLMQINLRYNNPEPNLVLSTIGRVLPDVITFEEVSPLWADKLDLIKATYRYSIFCPYPNRHWGVAIMSRRPFAEDRRPSCDAEGIFAVAPVNFGGQTAEVAALHLGWPWPFRQYREISLASPHLSQLGATAILAGDLNAVPWSRTAAIVAAAGGLTLMPSPGPTWQNIHLPRFLLFAGLPIDQIFAKGDAQVNSIRTLDPVGSDHAPVLVEFSLRPEPADKDEKSDVAGHSRGSGSDPSDASRS